MNNASQFLKIVGRNIRYYRQKRGFSQEKLAVRADLNNDYISRVERGMNNISAASLFRIAQALAVEPHLFFVSGVEKRGGEEKK
jgi:transcriptional regulator with XRE-family HTH domain